MQQLTWTLLSSAFSRFFRRFFDDESRLLRSRHRIRTSFLLFFLQNGRKPMLHNFFQANQNRLPGKPLRTWFPAAVRPSLFPVGIPAVSLPLLSSNPNPNPENCSFNETGLAEARSKMRDLQRIRGNCDGGSPVVPCLCSSPFPLPWRPLH